MGVTSYDQGVAEFKKMLAVAKTTPENLAQARFALEDIPETEVQRMMALGLRVLRTHPELPAIANNLEHVEDQLLKPVMDDANELARVFGIQPTCLRLLVILHDLGKVEIPGPMLRFLSSIFPDDFVAREILTHEYASMYWVQTLGDELGFTEESVKALQQLIANHNFGPDLCNPKYAYLRDNWWPTNYRNKIFPKLRELGFRLEEYFSKSEDGSYQYHHAEGDVYAALLALYDRAIANRYNLFGVGTWQKFAEQNYQGWKGKLGTQKDVPSPFQSDRLTKNMEDAARWAEMEVKAMWEILKDRYVVSDLRTHFDIESFGPYRHQVDGISKLKEAINRVKSANPEPAPGILYYETRGGDRYKVSDPILENPKGVPQLFLWQNEKQAWTLVAQDNSPIHLYFALVRGDL